MADEADQAQHQVEQELERQLSQVERYEGEPSLSAWNAGRRSTKGDAKRDRA